MILQFITTYWPDLLFLAILAFILAYLYKHQKKDTVYKIVLAAVVQAEKQLGSKTGELKYAVVVNKVYTILPAIVRMLFTKKDLNALIEAAVKKMKEYLSENGATLSGYEQEQFMNEYESDIKK